MKLLHFSDLHLGVELYGTLDSRTGLSSRVGDFLKVFDIIVEQAIEGGYDAVLFSGDAFKNRDPSPTLQREFARRVFRLAQAGVPIVIIVGNHDLPNVLTRATPVEIYQVLSIPGVHVCRTIERIDVETKSGKLQVVALPWVTRSMLLAADQYRAMGDVDLEREMSSLIANAVRGLMAELDPTLPAVLMAHVSVQGASLGYEQSIMLGRDVTVGLDDLNSRGFDYVALGHIHKHQVLGTNPPAVYAGSPERIDFGEEREAKGYVRVTIEPDQGRERTTTWEFVELPARVFKTVRIAAFGDDPAETARRDVVRLADEFRGAVTRCFIEVEPGREKSVNAQEIRRLLLERGAGVVTHVVVESETTGRVKDPISADTARDSIKMLQRWVEMRNYDPALRGRVVERGRELIERRQLEQGRSGSRG
ncbi:MAG TPA: exonuclease SbcCD subunit D [Thermomicrobiales bacterium]|nr:exonuclease SbcCD subunit D [Thermomicrobiales bacterium]